MVSPVAPLPARRPDISVTLHAVIVSGFATLALFVQLLPLLEVS
ncbi:MAG TPA: hypothetical protein VKB12_15535 [Pyrinomonadaceae bacterium]|nr:hypothetical protein [Pyrinomonadaceae bacterium]